MGPIKISGASEAEFQEQLTILECLDDDLMRWLLATQPILGQ